MSYKNSQYKRELASVFAQIDDKKLAFNFLEDLLTPGEFEEIAKRLQIAKRLDKGEAQRKIADDLGVGIATVTRGSREMRDKNGGFNKVLEKFYK